MPVAPARAAELFRLAAVDTLQSFDVNCWCYARAMRMTGLLLLNGVAPGDMGWVVISSPPAWLHERGRRPVMTAPPPDRVSMKTLLDGRSEIVFEDYLFRRVRTNGGADVIILARDGRPLTRPGSLEPLSYRFADPSLDSWWDNHIAPTVVCEGETSPLLVIDPELGDAPLAPGEWRQRQDPDGWTCILAADWDGRVTIDRSLSSAQTLEALAAASRRAHGDDCDEADLIAFLTDGGILGGSFDNPYNPPRVSLHGEPSILAAYEFFGEWLAPLAAFKRWRTQAIAQRETSKRPTRA